MLKIVSSHRQRALPSPLLASLSVISTQWKSKHGNRGKRQRRKKVLVWFSRPCCGILTGCQRALQRWELHQNKCCFLVAHSRFTVFSWSQLSSHEASRLLRVNQVSPGSISPLPPSLIRPRASYSSCFCLYRPDPIKIPELDGTPLRRTLCTTYIQQTVHRCDG